MGLGLGHIESKFVIGLQTERVTIFLKSCEEQQGQSDSGEHCGLWASCLSAVHHLQCYFTLTGGKKKPLKNPKKQSKDMDEVVF